VYVRRLALDGRVQQRLHLRPRTVVRVHRESVHGVIIPPTRHSVAFPSVSFTGRTRPEGFYGSNRR
jgi:hypothetical protein